MHRSEVHAPRARFPVMVRTLRGLEAIARTEVETVLGPMPVAVEHRALRFSLPHLDPRLLALGTVDDAFLVLAETDGIDHRRTSLQSLAALAGTVDAPTVLATLDTLRRLARPIVFDVTASFIGRRNYSRFDIENAVGSATAAATGWAYQPRTATQTAGPTSLSIRVHVLHTSAALSVRLAERPLHRRPYRVVSRAGALHPPLARALSVVAELAPGQLLVDPTCGVGTIPIEAALLEPHVRTLGFDLEPKAVRAALTNADHAGVHMRARVADATRLPIGQHSVDRIVTNPPWGEAVATGGGLRRSPHTLWTELGRILAVPGRLVALVPAGSDAERGLRGAGFDAHVVSAVRVSGAEAVILAAIRA